MGADPAAALRGLAKHALSPRGGLGLMVYGTRASLTPDPSPHAAEPASGPYPLP